jgi:ketosteroid isomerase-like protein
LSAIQIVEAGLQAFNERDVERFAELTTEDFVWLPALPGAVEGGSYRGRSGINRYFAESQSTWELLTLTGDELRELNGSVLMLGRALGRGLGSGVEVQTPLAFIAEFRGERMAKVSTYLNHADALKAVGLDS